jgi:CMP-N,N'-diacetyllegionaminic acid synthase
MIKYIIPARRNSKGLPFKNRKLFEYTIKSIPYEFLNSVIVTTDDEVIIDKCKSLDINYVFRDPLLALDETSTKDVIIDLVNRGLLTNDDMCVMLYLTYPERTWDDIIKAMSFMVENQAKSLLCKKIIKGTHPYLYMFEGKNYTGTQLVEHNLYRRQDYPKVFEISHFISIFEIFELFNLNGNLYNKNTVYYPIGDVTDVDTDEDFETIIF